MRKPTASPSSAGQPDARAPARAPAAIADAGSDPDEVDVTDAEAAVIEIPINGVLDLHTFQPREVQDLLPEYIGECLARGLLSLRIIHGKGRGILREHVRKILARDPRVASVANADETAGSFGATLVTLHPLPPRNF